jgi:glycosyltransferase involved in cell wall biosynthesis
MSQTVPSKIQAYLAAGRPIIASLDGEGARVVVEAGAGVACPAQDAQALADAVRQLRDALPEKRQRIARCGRLYYEQHFEPKLLARRLAQILSSLVSERLAADTETKNG